VDDYQGVGLLSRWRLSDWTFGLLAALALWAAWESFVITNRPQTRGCGGNFSQYYVAGSIVRGGDIKRLYDQPYFLHLQESLRDDPLPSIYPPTVATLVAPLSVLSFGKALTVWWTVQAICLFATGLIFYRTAEIARPWRINMLMALAAMMPLGIAVMIGQLAPILVLVLAGGIALHRRGKPVLAGLVLSLLALKPQLAVGLVLWMLLRRDFRTLLGLAAGFALQVAAVAAVAGPTLWFDYVHALPEISAITRRAHFSPMVEASFTGIASNMTSAAGWTAWESVAMKLAYAASVSAAIVMLCRVVWSRKSNTPCSLLPAPCSPPEYACGVLFMLIVPPYLIVYDQTLIAVALVMLWSSPAWRWGLALYAATTVIAANLSLTLGFSLTPFVALAVMFPLMKAATAQASTTAETPRVPNPSLQLEATPRHSLLTS
jgi:hypothetical protein